VVNEQTTGTLSPEDRGGEAEVVTLHEYGGYVIIIAVEYSQSFVVFVESK
jgi:hypothetical protein